MLKFPFAMPSYGVFALMMRDDGRVLIKQRSAPDALWDLPGGGRDQNETDQLQTLIREVMEETKCDVSKHRVIPLGDPLPLAMNRGRVDVAQPFLVDRANVEPQLTDEAKAFKWVNHEEACEMIMTGLIVGPKNRLGRTPRMILDALAISNSSPVSFETEVPDNFSTAREDEVNLSKDKQFLCGKDGDKTFAFRRTDPFSPDGLYYPS